MLLKIGAEASLYLEKWQNRKVIFKKRLPKKYRVPELDAEIRHRRTIHESQLIHNAKRAGIPTPTILMIDVINSTIIMEFIEGEQIKHILDHLPPKERLYLCRNIGKLIGRLHTHGIIHGDLTTSNMILDPYKKVIFLDFGLSERSYEIESRGVDLHLMKRALQSTHFNHADESFKAIIEGYAEIMEDLKTRKVLKKIKEIERRGRYVSGR